MPRASLIMLVSMACLHAPAANAQSIPNEGKGVLSVPESPLPAPLPMAPRLPPVVDLPAAPIAKLEREARGGDLRAIWRLGRMYADGDGVQASKVRAFEYFRRLTDQHSEKSPGSPEARFVADAFVTLGLFYLDGVPEAVAPDPKIAFEMFRYAAAYYADPAAQYHLGRLYLEGKGAPKDALQAARWLRLSALKGEYRAQALLGASLLKGDGIPRQAALGLFWLTIAKDSAIAPADKWIAEAYAEAVAQSNETDRVLAYRYLENWLKNQNPSRP